MNAASSGISKASPPGWLLRIFTPATRRQSATCQPRPVAASDPPAAVPAKKVLIVDDDVVLLKTTSLKLKAQGYAVFTAVDAAAAIQVVHQEKPDVILLDLSFPPDVAHGGTVAWDGFLIMSWLRRLEAARNIPVIIITGSDPAKFKQRAMASGALAYFHKPIEHESLLSAIKLILENDAERHRPVFDLDFHICF